LFREAEDVPNLLLHARSEVPRLGRHHDVIPSSSIALRFHRVRSPPMRARPALALVLAANCGPVGRRSSRSEPGLSHPNRYAEASPTSAHGLSGFFGLRFVEKDLAAAPTATLGYQLRALASTLRDSPRVIGLDPMPAAELRDYQQQLAKGIKATLAWGVWELPPQAYVVSRIPAPAGRIAIRKHILDPGSEGQTILHAAAQAIMDMAERLRLCRDPKCGRPFVAKDARALYCSPKCSMRVRNRDRRAGARKGK
jgi:hypothetical protein